MVRGGKNPAYDTNVKVNSIFVQECKKKKKKEINLTGFKVCIL